MSRSGAGNSLSANYRSWRSAWAISNLGWYANVFSATFVGYLGADRQGSAAVLGMGAPTIGKSSLAVTGVLAARLIAGALGLIITSTLRGRAGAEDATTSPFVGAIDVGQVPLIAAQLGVFGVFWLTSQFPADVLNGARTLGVYLLSSTVIGFTATATAAARHATRPPETRFRQRLPIGVRVTGLTADRLVVTQQSMVLRLAAAGLMFWWALSVGLNARLAAQILVSSSVTDRWIGAGYLTIVGCGAFFTAGNRRVVFDRAACRIEIRNRWIWRRATVTPVSLAGSSAVVVRHEVAGPSRLTNVSIRTGGGLVPVIIGSRLAKNARGHALVIGRFLDVPVYEEDTLLSVSDDVSVSDIIDIIDDLRGGDRPRRID